MRDRMKNKNNSQTRMETKEINKKNENEIQSH